MKLFGSRKEGSDNTQPSAEMEGSLEQTRAFNQLFVLANNELSKGSLDGLGEGIRILSEALKYAGTHREAVSKAIGHLKEARKCFQRPDTKGPWNRDLSGYGILSWQADLARLDEQLKLAWQSISSINEDLKKQGLGVRFGKN